MTNFLRSFAPECAGCLAALVLLAGCGGSNDPAATDDPAEATEAAAKAFAVGDYAAALAHCRRSLELAPGVSDVLVLQGRAAFASGDVQATDEAVAAALAACPDDVAVIQLAAQTAFAKGDHTTAFKCYTRLAFDEKLPPEIRAIGYAGRGVVGLARVGEGNAPDDCRDVALTDFLQALQLDRRNTPARYHLGLLYRNAFHFNQPALEQFSAYAALMKNTDDPHVAKAQSQIAELNKEIADELARRTGMRQRNPGACTESLRKADGFFQKGRFRDAATHYAEALKHDAQSFEAADRLAQCYEKTDSSKIGMTKAYKAYCHAVSLRTYAKTLVSAATLAYKLGNWQSSVTLYARAVAAKPNDITAIDGLIRALQKCGKSKSAAVYQRYRNSLPKRN